jgi:hypothetical protein
MLEDRMFILVHWATGVEEAHQCNWIGPVHTSPATTHVPLLPVSRIVNDETVQKIKHQHTTTDGE